MKIWLLKAAGTLEDEEIILKENIITIGWAEFQDLSHIKNEKEVKKLMLDKYPGMQEVRGCAWAGEIFSFVTKMKKGDLVAVPLKTKNEVLIGRVAGNYEHRQLSNFISHIRKVRWLKTLSKGTFEEEFDVSLSSPETLVLIKAPSEKFLNFIETKSLEALIEELNFVLDDLCFLRERMLESLHKLEETEDINEARRLAIEMEKLIKEK
jgi:predicted Mrr-cat superfamily restriction endonuclease